MKLKDASVTFLAGLILNSAESFDREDTKQALDVLNEMGATTENFPALEDLVETLTLNFVNPLKDNFVNPLKDN